MSTRSLSAAVARCTRRAKEKEEKEEKKMAQLAEMRDSQMKRPGYQRLRAQQYDELRRQLVSREGNSLRHSTTISNDVLTSFRQTGRDRGPMVSALLPLRPRHTTTPHFSRRALFVKAASANRAAASCCFYLFLPCLPCRLSSSSVAVSLSRHHITRNCAGRRQAHPNPNHPQNPSPTAPHRPPSGTLNTVVLP